LHNFYYDIQIQEYDKEFASCAASSLRWHGSPPPASVWVRSAAIGNAAMAGDAALVHRYLLELQSCAQLLDFRFG